ncbi:MAG: MerR family transcriptional regulator [Thermodesulfobacteriota bacterium]
MNKHQRLYRIAEIEKITDVPRRRIHFYIQSGLLNKPLKTGKTMAYYDDSHIRQLQVIKKARQRGESLFSVKDLVKDIAPASERKVSDYYTVDAVEGEVRPDTVRKKTRGRNSQKTRERILSVGCEMFRKCGYNNTRLNDLTRELDIGKGTFYFYFSDKKELFLECVPRIFEEMFSSGWDDIRKLYNPVERLEMRFQLALNALEEFCIILQLAKEAMADTDPKLKELGQKTYLSIRGPLESDIKKAITRGIFQPVNVEMMASLMIAIVENTYYMREINSDLSMEAMKIHIYNLLAYGLVGAGERLPVPPEK